MKLASFNLENLFDRAKALNFADWDDGKPILEAFQKVNALFNKAVYTAADKKKILEHLKALGVLKNDDGPYAKLRQNRGRLLKRANGKPVEVVAGGRGDWIGWVELETEPVDEIATRMTAQVIRDVDADVMGVIEVDDRIALKRFNDQLLPAVGGAAYDHVMLIDGNDDRGIDVGFMSRASYPIASMCSHVDDMNGSGPVFSRDCPEYEIELAGGQKILVLVNHLKSKGFGGQASSNARRLEQATRVRAIYDERLASGTSLIAVIGDLNDYPDGGPLDPLLKNGGTLKDVSAHPAYQDDGRPGTFKNGTKTQKLDYILLSPALFQKVTSAGVFRTGVW